MKKYRISVIGLGKLGMNMAACLAFKGYHVIGVDINKTVVDKVNLGEAPLFEPGLDDMMRLAKDNLEATTDNRYAVKNSDIVFIFVGTPSEKEGGFSSHYVEEVAKEVAYNLKSVDEYRLIVNRSTVLPGVTETKILPIIEESSGKKVGVDFGLCFNPEFMALGSAIKNFLNPDVVAIGESDGEAGKHLYDLYKTVCDNDPPIVRTSLTNAEWSKLSLNVFLTVKMSYANTIAEICEKIKGGDVDKISDILGYDIRIGRKFLSGGIGYGGPCFPRDTKAFTYFANEVGCQAELSIAAEKVNDYQSVRVVDGIISKVGSLEGKVVSVLGLTYKPDTDIVDPSDAVKITQLLIENGARIKAYDPKGVENAKNSLPTDRIEFCDSISDCLSNTDLCVLTTPWPDIVSIKADDIIRSMNTPMVFDCWREWKKLALDERVDYNAVGINADIR